MQQYSYEELFKTSDDSDATSNTTQFARTNNALRASRIVTNP